MERNAMKEGLPSDRLQLVHWELSRGGLRREIRVIPVLVQGAEMPQSDELPESLASLAQRNAIEIRDSSGHQDVRRLIQTLEKIERRRPSK
jgi:hypothetical protein